MYFKKKCKPELGSERVSFAVVQQPGRPRSVIDKPKVTRGSGVV